MKKSKVSSSVDYIYIETLLNKQMRSNIRMLHNRIVNVPVTQNQKPLSQNQRRIVSMLNSKETTKEQQITSSQAIENKIHMNSLCQPMIIHSHRPMTSKAANNLESPKFRRSCIHCETPSQIRYTHFLKKGTQNDYQNSKPWHPLMKLSCRKLVQQSSDCKQLLNTQSNICTMTQFQSIVDLSGWQTNEDPQMEIQ